MATSPSFYFVFFFTMGKRKTGTHMDTYMTCMNTMDTKINKNKGKLTTTTVELFLL